MRITIRDFRTGTDLLLDTTWPAGAHIRSTIRIIRGRAAAAYDAKDSSYAAVLQLHTTLKTAHNTQLDRVSESYTFVLLRTASATWKASLLVDGRAMDGADYFHLGNTKYNTAQGKAPCDGLDRMKHAVWSRSALTCFTARAHTHTQSIHACWHGSWKSELWQFSTRTL